MKDNVTYSMEARNYPFCSLFPALVLEHFFFTGRGGIYWHFLELYRLNEFKGRYIRADFVSFGPGLKLKAGLPCLSLAAIPFEMLLLGTCKATPAPFPRLNDTA